MSKKQKATTQKCKNTSIAKLHRIDGLGKLVNGYVAITMPLTRDEVNSTPIIKKEDLVGIYTAITIMRDLAVEVARNLNQENAE
ncbi:hypothetical protein RvVAR0630_18260 [Agrobacterium vitis]|uniref:hypothetical protein n=1 Tax=Agrobacterium vitis TaxID=373 RepID=UPI0015D6BDF2|nr:hypothetical protein [Agrobacterium vitis]BCH59202.1 hypothetical protein RvVAR0630_18260 [Agrobacterium vitis]